MTSLIDFSLINIFKFEMSYFDLVGCMNEGKSTYMNCALKNSEAFLQNERRNAELRSQQYQRKIEQDAAREKTTRLVLFVIIILVVIVVLVCAAFIKKKKKELYANTERISRNREILDTANLCRLIRVDHVTCQGVHEHEIEGQLLERSSIPVHQIVCPSAPVVPVLPFNNLTTSNVFGNNRPSSTGNREQILEDSPPTYNDCMKNKIISHWV